MSWHDLPPLTESQLRLHAASGLRSLLFDHWEATMVRSPVWATRLGDHRWDDRLDDTSPAALVAARAERDTFLKRAEGIDAALLPPADQVTLELFRGELRTSAAVDACHGEQWGLSARNNALIGIGELADIQPITTPEEGAHYLARLRAYPTLVDNELAHLRTGILEGRTPERGAVDIVIEQLDRALDDPPEAWPAAAPGLAAHPDWPDASGYRSQVLAALVQGTIPALKRYRTFLVTELRPAARPPERAGVWALPNGDTCYAALIERETSLTLSADEIHAIGLRELEGIHAEMRALGQTLFGTSELAEIFRRLREDPALRFRTEEEVEAKAASALANAKAKIPAFFGRIPQADCGVRRIPDYEAPYTTIAYYRQAVPNEQPGYYYVNVYAPETRPRFEAEVLAFHESIPGHHLQIAIAQELPDLPEFRRHIGTTAYVEGWALYTERLADEMGLYSSDLDRMGILSFDAWRATRLVVDTGIHARRWDRARAVQFFTDNTPLALNNVANEVDRYITWPGQALAYKLGQIEVRSLRAEAEAALGGRFSLPRFHDVVLGGGAVTLPVLRAQVRAWISAGG